ncbi:MAG TPA: hypothetical protein VMW08_00960 [Acidimicrobiales bacterium]|nr:hypothetical protein [Acidimicrobiales bacterium]
MGFEEDKRQWEGIYALLNQGRLWVDRDANRVEIAEMPATYRANVVRWLRSRAVGLEWKYGFGEAISMGRYEDAFGLPDDFDIPMHDDEWPLHIDLRTAAGKREWRELCLGWIEGTRLVRSLRVGAEVTIG